jgi:hypothetical protein
VNSSYACWLIFSRPPLTSIGAKVTDFICTPLTSLAQSKTRAFVIFSCLLGAVLKFPRALLFFMFLHFLGAGFWAWRALGGLLAHGMKRDENVHLR